MRWTVVASIVAVVVILLVLVAMATRPIPYVGTWHCDADETGGAVTFSLYRDGTGLTEAGGESSTLTWTPHGDHIRIAVKVTGEDLTAKLKEGRLLVSEERTTRAFGREGG
jgi:hypothetical protein